MYANLSNFSMYYQKQGKGNPIILIHGNMDDHNIFKALSFHLKDKYTVYNIDSRGHGNSIWHGRNFHYDDMANDLSEFIELNKLSNVTLIGFSDGAIISLIYAINNPNNVDKLVLAGLNISPSGLISGFLTQLKLRYFFNRSRYLKLMIKEPNIDIKNLNLLKIKTLLTFGEHDLITKKHMKLINESISNSRLVIFKGFDHGNYIINNKIIFKDIDMFLKEE